MFSPHFPTFLPNIERRQARAVLAPLSQKNEFRPDVDRIKQFLAEDPSPKAIFLNSPHNPTGGVATEDDLKAIADVVRGRNVAVFSDEPYCHMVWKGRHRSLLEQPGMLDHAVAAYTFSKSYSMSGWRLGFAVSAAPIADAIGKMINTCLSCVPPIVQLAGLAALQKDTTERDRVMQLFREKVVLLTSGLNQHRRDSLAGSDRDVLRLPERRADLQPARDHESRPGAVPARGRGRRVRRRLPRRRVLRGGRRRLPALQLRGAERAPAAGARFPARRDRAGLIG